MSVCPGCGHNNDDVMMICTRCGASLRPDRPPRPGKRGPGKPFYPRVALWLLLGVLLSVLVFLVFIYLDTIGKIAPLTLEIVMQPHGILEAVLYARDLAAGQRFYVEVLGLEVFTEQTGRHVFFRCGRGMFLLFNPNSTAQEPTQVNGSLLPLHGAGEGGHLAFAVKESELETWRRRLLAAGVDIESEVRWPNGGRSLYFRDPAGNSVELATPRLWGLREDGIDP